MGSIYVLVLMFTAVAALLSIPIFYLWAWAAGPAVKYLGQKWEEGRIRAYNRYHAELHEEYMRGLADAWSGHVIRPQSPAPRFGESNTTAPEPTSQYTITGKRIR